MLKFMRVIAGLTISFGLIGCSILKVAIGTNQSWSRNYARLPGTTATAPEMIDGDYRTTGKTTFPEGASAAMGISAFSEAVIQLPEKKSIHRIVIHSDKLQQFDIMVNSNRGYITLKEVKSMTVNPIDLRVSTTTDKIKVRVRKSSDDIAATRQSTGGRRRGLRRVAATIQEIELYGFSDKSEAKPIEEAEPIEKDEMDRFFSP